jgi:hypothetical protein
LDIQKPSESPDFEGFLIGLVLAFRFVKDTNLMILKFFFRQMSLQKQVNFLKKRGIMLGTRLKDGRRIYIYMLRDLFIEVLFKNDNVNENAERLNMLEGLNNLNEYLEKEFRASF